jgi:AAA+ superfamily predicted ATPase
MLREPGSSKDQLTQGPKTLQDALKYIEELRTSEVKGRSPDPETIAIFHNVRQFVSNHVIIQQLQDAIMSAKYEGCTIILVGPHIDFPPELKNFITVVDCPLPTQEELKEDFKKMVAVYKNDLDLPSNKEEFQDLLTAATKAAVGLDSLGAENALSLSMVARNTIDLSIIQSQKEQEVRKSDVLEFVPPVESMDSVGGYDMLKSWYSKRKKVFTKEAREYGLPYPKGVLLVGVAGGGKSLCAKAIAEYLDLVCLRLDMGKVFRSLLGDSEAAIRMALQVAEAVSPVVLWLDEIDMGLAGASGANNDSGVSKRVVSTILTWRQETTYPVTLVGTANSVEDIPPMVYRKGRLDEVWAVDLPNIEEREQIYSIHIKKRKREPEKFDTALLAKKAKGFVGSEIEASVEDAMFTAFDQGREFNTKDILRAISDTIPQAERDKEEVERIRKWSATRARLVSKSIEEPVRRQGSKVRKLNK